MSYCNELKQIYKKNTVDDRVIYSFVDFYRKIIATHLRNIYKLEKLAYNNNHHIGVDESLFSHNNGNQMWIVGLLNHVTNNLRLELVESRTSEVLKYII